MPLLQCPSQYGSLSFNHGAWYMIPRSGFAKASRSIMSELELSDYVEGDRAMDGRYS